MSEIKNPLTGILNAGALGDFINEAMTTEPQDIAQVIDKHARKMLANAGIPVPNEETDDIDENDPAYKKLSAEHEIYHEIGSEERKYFSRQYPVYAIMFDGENHEEITAFCHMHKIGYAVKANGDIYIAAPEGVAGSPAPLREKWFLIYMPKSDYNDHVTHAIYPCAQFQTEFELPVEVRREQAAEQEFEDAAADESNN